MKYFVIQIFFFIDFIFVTYWFVDFSHLDMCTFLSLSGDLLFIDVDRLHLLHSFKIKFTHPLVPAFSVSTELPVIAVILHYSC